MTERKLREQYEKIAWRAKNRGKLAEIADSLGLSRQFVGDVYNGKRGSRGRFVEAALADAGAPGFEKESS